MTNSSTPRDYRGQYASTTPDPFARLRFALYWQRPERAAAILNGTDPEANADLAAWRKLGRPA